MASVSSLTSHIIPSFRKCSTEFSRLTMSSSSTCVKHRSLKKVYAVKSSLPLSVEGCRKESKIQFNIEVESAVAEKYDIVSAKNDVFNDFSSVYNNLLPVLCVLTLSSGLVLGLSGEASAAGLVFNDGHQIPAILLAELNPETAKTLTFVLRPLFSALNFLFIIRIVMSWYPQLPVDKLPFSIVFTPTEPVLGPTRRLIPPVGGVDVAPVIWVAFMSFLNEILLGQQGLLILLSQKQF